MVYILYPLKICTNLVLKQPQNFMALHLETIHAKIKNGCPFVMLPVITLINHNSTILYTLPSVYYSYQI